MISWLTLLGSVVALKASEQIDTKNSYVEWSGLKDIHQPVNYFYIFLRDADNNPLPEGKFVVQIEENGVKEKSDCQNCYINRHDGSYIFRYRGRNHMEKVTFHVTDLDGNPIRNSGRKIEKINHPTCSCPLTLEDFLEKAEPSMNFDQIYDDFSIFPKIETKLNNQRVIERFCDNPGAVSICRYRIKDNKVYRSCEGIHVGFKMFSDELLLTLARMVKLPDVEFWMNLGDWPQQKYSQNPKTPAAVISWCGHEDFTDIVVPTYDVAENTMGMMYKVAQDQFKLQDEARKVPWEEKSNKLFFRGRDSNQQRLGRFYHFNTFYLDERMNKTF